MINKKIPLLSGVIICQNEENRILKPIEQIYDYVYEIVVLDGGSNDNTIKILKEFKENNDPNNKLRIYQNKFNGHFGDQKNIAISKVKSRWVLNLDADEFLDEKFLNKLEEYLYQDEYDVFAFPRVNTLDGEQTDGWPDYQLRLFRSYCRFVYPVHEELVGFKNKKELPDDECIYHHKSSSRQELQNESYTKLEIIHANFIPNPLIDDEDEE